MSLSRRLIFQFKIEFVGQLIAVTASGLLTITLARLLQPSGYGLLFFAISILAVARIFSQLGIAKSSARYVTEYLEKDPTQVKHIIKKSIIYNSIAIIVVSGGLLLSHEYIGIAVGEPAVAELLQIGVFYVVFSSFAIYARLTAQSFEDIKLAALINVLRRVGQLVLSVVLVVLGFDVAGAMWGYAFGFGIAAFVGLSLVYTNHYLKLEKPTKIQQGLSTNVLRYSIPLTVTKMSGKIDKQVDTILVGFFLNPVAVSFYVLGKQISEFVQFPATALGFTTAPKYSKQKENEQSATAARLYETALSRTLLVYLPAVMGVILVAEPGIILVFGEDYSGAVPVLQVFSAYILLQAITKITDQPLDYLGRARSRAIAKSIASASNVLLNILLIPTIGVLGAVFATIITHSFYVSVKLYIVYTELPLRGTYILRYVSKVLVVTVGMSVVVWGASSLISGYLTLLLTILCGVLSWAIFSSLLGILTYEDVSRLAGKSS